MIYVDVHISRDMESDTSKCSDSLRGWDHGKFFFFSLLMWISYYLAISIHQICNKQRETIKKFKQPSEVWLRLMVSPVSGVVGRVGLTLRKEGGGRTGQALTNRNHNMDRQVRGGGVVFSQQPPSRTFSEMKLGLDASFSAPLKWNMGGKECGWIKGEWHRCLGSGMECGVCRGVKGRVLAGLILSHFSPASPSTCSGQGSSGSGWESMVIPHHCSFFSSTKLSNRTQNKRTWASLEEAQLATKQWNHF